MLSSASPFHKRALQRAKAQENQALLLAWSFYRQHPLARNPAHRSPEVSLENASLLHPPKAARLAGFELKDSKADSTAAAAATAPVAVVVPGRHPPGFPPEDNRLQPWRVTRKKRR